MLFHNSQLSPLRRIALNVRCYHRGGSWDWCWGGVKRALRDLATDAAHVVLILGGIYAVYMSFWILGGAR